MKNLLICEPKEIHKDFVVITIDSKKVTSLREFYETLATSLYFPDYFGFNMDSLDELLNDLSWLEDEKIAVYFTNTKSFLINERSEDKILSLLDMLDAISEDWKWMEPDEDLGPDDDDYIPKKELLFCFEDSDEMADLLNKL
ncbi:barstar family protein [Lacihabitans lacunae]|jgi:RNAse (barnase) inhibitor barstar|uniref:Barstar family protein n=1 Tax=Lacihabitans lacunae TaxID=1028214 RepID=A0ABV7Z0Q1_9BACT